MINLNLSNTLSISARKINKKLVSRLNFLFPLIFCKFLIQTKIDYYSTIFILLSSNCTSTKLVVVPEPYRTRTELNCTHTVLDWTRPYSTILFLFTVFGWNLAPTTQMCSRFFFCIVSCSCVYCRISTMNRIPVK